MANNPHHDFLDKLRDSITAHHSSNAPPAISPTRLSLDNKQNAAIPIIYHACIVKFPSCNIGLRRLLSPSRRYKILSRITLFHFSRAGVIFSPYIPQSRSDYFLCRVQLGIGISTRRGRLEGLQDAGRASSFSLTCLPACTTRGNPTSRCTYGRDSLPSWLVQPRSLVLSSLFQALIYLGARESSAS